MLGIDFVRQNTWMDKVSVFSNTIFILTGKKPECLLSGSLTWTVWTCVASYPDSKVHGANMGPIWGRQDPGGPHVGPMNFVIWVVTYSWDISLPITCILIFELIPHFHKECHKKFFSEKIVFSNVYFCGCESPNLAQNIIKYWDLDRHNQRRFVLIVAVNGLLTG